MNYVLVVRPRRPTFPGDGTEEERRIFGEHFQYVKQGFEAGAVKFVGRCEDATFGLIVFSAGSDEEAQRFAENDPAVSAGIFTKEVRPFLVVFDKE